MGLELSDVSLGGESEEVYDDNGDDYFYTASLSFSLQVDWFIHFPLVVPIQTISNHGIQLTSINSPVTGLGNRPRQTLFSVFYSYSISTLRI